MKLLDLIRTIEIVHSGHEIITIKINEKEYPLQKDHIQQKRNTIRSPLEEQDIEYIYFLPFELNIVDTHMWITKGLEYMIIWDYPSDELLILNFQELKEQDESYLVLKYGKILLEKIGE